MPPSQLLPPTFGYPYDLGQVAMRQGLMADANAHRASVSSNRCSPSPAETRSIGTNTSIVFETKLATKVDRGANTTFAGGKAESESAIKTVVEKVTGTSMQLASREPFTVATSCMADLEKSMEKANLENYRPPADTGTNYMPFYTYEPFEEREIDFGDPPPPQTDSKKDTFDFSKEIDITGEDDEDSMRRRSHVREAMFQPLLDISKIGDTSFFGRSMDTNLIEEPKWAEDQKEQATVETKEDDDIRERTMELIAKLADNPEKSFILIDENKRRKKRGGGKGE
ncbi:hypothetical protein BC829DRAFT_258148 [Chytridium lagenaria]|nr:hypothetical protein BC829DRAFT_258148 [Chytridium lagenaria]